MSYTKHNFVSGDTLLASDLNAMEDQISVNEQTGLDLKSAVTPIFANDVSIEKGYFAVTDGAPSASNTWCRTKNFVPRNYRFTTSVIEMLLCAFNKRTNAYIGSWDGTTFANVYNGMTMLIKDIDVNNISILYPDYAFKLDFYNGGQALDVNDVINDITINDIHDKKQDIVCHNLVGETFGKLYPISLVEGMYLTISTSDGEVLGGEMPVYVTFYGERNNYIDFYSFVPGRSVRTIGPLTAELTSAKYIAIRNVKPRVPLMINVGQVALPYEKYYMSAYDLTEKTNSTDIAYIHKEDCNAVYAIKRHYGINNSTDNGFKALVVSDIHEEITRTNRMVELLNDWGSSYFDIAINTGDTVRTLFSQDISWYDNAIAKSAIPVLNTIGNHDAWENLNGTLANKVNVYNKFIAPVASSTTIVQPTNASTNGLNYYYKDVNEIRVVVLDCMYWNADELAWFNSVLADALTNELAVIACSHAPFASEYCQLLQSAWNVGWFHRDGTKTPIDAASAVQTFITNGGTFICWLMGHIHGDEIEILPNHGNQLVICTNTFQDRGTTVVKNTSENAYNYDSLSYITVDAINKYVKLYRIGANIDTAGHKRNGFVWDYDNKTFVTEY